MSDRSSRSSEMLRRFSDKRVEDLHYEGVKPLRWTSDGETQLVNNEVGYKQIVIKAILDGGSKDEFYLPIAEIYNDTDYLLYPEFYTTDAISQGCIREKLKQAGFHETKERLVPERQTEITKDVLVYSDETYGGRSTLESETWLSFSLSEVIQTFTMSALTAAPIRYKFTNNIKRSLSNCNYFNPSLQDRKDKPLLYVFSNITCSPWDVVAWARQSGNHVLAEEIRVMLFERGWDDRIASSALRFAQSKPSYSRFIKVEKENCRMTEDLVARDFEKEWLRIPDRPGSVSLFLKEVLRLHKISSNERFNKFMIEILKAAKYEDASQQDEFTEIIKDETKEKGQPREFIWNNARKKISPSLLLQKGDQFDVFKETSRFGWIQIINYSNEYNAKSFNLRLESGVLAWQRTGDQEIVHPDGVRSFDYSKFMVVWFV